MTITAAAAITTVAGVHCNAVFLWFVQASSLHDNDAA